MSLYFDGHKPIIIIFEDPNIYITLKKINYIIKSITRNDQHFFGISQLNVYLHGNEKMCVWNANVFLTRNAINIKHNLIWFILRYLKNLVNLKLIPSSSLTYIGKSDSLQQLLWFYCASCSFTKNPNCLHRFKNEKCLFHDACKLIQFNLPKIVNQLLNQ